MLDGEPLFVGELPGQIGPAEFLHSRAAVGGATEAEAEEEPAMQWKTYMRGDEQLCRGELLSRRVWCLAPGRGWRRCPVRKHLWMTGRPA